jgi:DNA-binding transcriptional ArsR family regulator
MHDPDELARVFKAFSVGSRVRIVQLLSSNALCVNVLAKKLGMTQAAVSQHLRVLREVGLVSPKRRGYYVHYGVDAEAVAKWNEAIAGLLAAATDEADGLQPEGGKSCVAASPSARNPQN